MLINETPKRERRRKKVSSPIRHVTHYRKHLHNLYNSKFKKKKK